METWYDAAKRYPHDDTSASLILIHLSFGPDYPYHISRSLKHHIDKMRDHPDWIRGLGSLCYPNLMSEIMKELASEDFIILDDSIISKNKRDYYRINPAVLANPIKPSSDFIPKKLISDKLIQELLQVMYLDKSRRYNYFRNRLQYFNFITFLELHKGYALKHHMNIIARKLDWYIYEMLTKKTLIQTEARAKSFIKILDLSPRLKKRRNQFRTPLGTMLLDDSGNHE